MPRFTPALVALVLVLATDAGLSGAEVSSNGRSATPKNAVAVTADAGSKNTLAHVHTRPKFRRDRMVERARARARARTSAERNAKTKLELAKAVALIKP